MSTAVMAMATFVILTGKPGLFRTEPNDDLRPVERYDYVFFGRTRARFVIALLERETRIVVVDEALPPTFNSLPSRLLKKYDSVAAARRDLEHLVKPKSPGAALKRVME